MQKETVCPAEPRSWGAFVLVATLLFSGCLNSDNRLGGRSSDEQQSVQPQQSTSASNAKAALPTLSTNQDRSENSLRLMDPNQDGWLTEALAEKSKKQLGLVLSRLSKTTDPQNNSLSELVNDAVALGPLRQVSEFAFDDNGLRVKRPGQKQPASEQRSLVDTLRDLIAPLVEIGQPEFHVKVVRVRLGEQARARENETNGKKKRGDTKPGFMTTCLYEAQARNEQVSLQQTATLVCHWEYRSESLRLANIESSDFEEVQLSGNNGPWFVDCTETVIGGEPEFQRQLAYGTNHWMQRIERAHGMDDTVSGAGLAVGDANGDGLEDVYVCQGPGLPNRLFLQNPDGTVTDRSVEAGVDWLDHTSAALFLDFDNDDDQDLAIATKGGLLLMENDGNGNFTKRAELTQQMTDVQSLTSADYDSDGDLDLFLCAYRHISGRLRGEFVFHDATTGGRNYLFQNNIDQEWKFTDVTEAVGLDAGSTRYTLAAAWEDYDNDGDPDLYVANDYGPNYLFRNEGGRFTNQTAAAGLTDTGFGMSVSWGDYDRDGRMDLYIGNMFSSAGSRITRQAKFQSNSNPQQRALYQRMAKGNSLFANQSDNVFRDVSNQAQVEMGRWAWSSVFADINNDGWEDLLVANGYITTDDTGDL